MIRMMVKKQKRQINQPVTSGSEAEKHHLIGNALCLDFANTLYGHGGTPLHEYLRSYRDLVIWSRKAGVLDDSDAEKLLRRADRQPNEALSVFHRAIALRETIYRVFAALVNGAEPKNVDLAVLNAARTAALAHSRVDRAGKRFAVDWDDETALDRMLWQIALSAGELLVSNNLRRVRQCRGETCDWLFVDTSRNQMRRWCQMRVCGNRAKVHRFLRRQRRLTARRR
jgi:predicted RNA-binding Zn ribbon-like protein